MNASANCLAAGAELLSLSDFRQMFKEFNNKTTVSNADRPAYLNGGAPGTHEENLNRFHEHAYNYFFVEHDLIFNSQAEVPGLGGFDPETAKFDHGKHFMDVLRGVRNDFFSLYEAYRKSGSNCSGDAADEDVQAEIEAAGNEEVESLSAVDL